MKKKRVVFIVLLAITGLVALYDVARDAGGRTAASRQKIEGVSRQRELILTRENATPIREGVLTEKQKKHGKIYHGYEGVTRGRRIAELIREKGDVELRGPLSEVPRVVPPPPLSEILARVTCESDAVIIGTVRGRSSHLMEGGTFLFSDYEIVVDEALKNSLASAPAPASTITVTRAGGAVLLNGRFVRAIDWEMAPLEVGERYLLYLKYLPETGAYRPTYGTALLEDTFHLDGERAAQVSRRRLPLGWEQTAELNEFMVQVRSALTIPCTTGASK